MALNLPQMTAGDRKKAYVLGGLAVLLLAVVAWNVLPSMRKTPAKPPAASKPVDGRVRNSDLAKGKAGETGAGAPIAQFGPIEELPPILPVSTGAALAGRNIFAYPPPPTPKPPPKEIRISPPPPTINLGSIAPQQAFAGTPKAAAVTLYGSLFPRDVQVLVDNRVLPSQRISDSMIKVTLSPEDLATPRSINIELRSYSQPKPLWSARKVFSVVPSPDPSDTFVFTGRVGSQAVLAFKDDRRPKLVSVGDSISGNVPWRVVAFAILNSAVPDQRIQGKRETEIEMMYRGQQMAEAIARYYSAGKLTPAGLVVKSPPPPYGYLTELRKLRDGVLIGLDNVYFSRASAFIDPLTNDDWEPVRIGDPRLRKFFRAWQASTGRQIPPLYLSYLGSGAVVDTSEQPDEEEPGVGEGTQVGPSSGDEEDEGDDADDDEGDDEDEEFDEEEDGDEDEEYDEDEDEGAWRRTSDGTMIVAAALQTSNLNSNVSRAPQVQRPNQPRSVFGSDSARTGPIIGVATRARGKSVRTWYGIDKYQDMIFIYIPNNVTVRSAQVQQQSSGQPQQQGGTDANGDGIPDTLKPDPQQKP